LRVRVGMRALDHDFCTRGNFSLGKDQVMLGMILKFNADENGAAAIEYGLLAAGIAVAIIAVVAALGTELNTTFTSVSSGLK
jgi:pilus assembly protein Flp/PilA